MDQRNETFVPHVLAIVAGTTVDFPNSDQTYHNVFSLSKTRSFDLGRYAVGRSKSVRFDRPGIVRVFCDIHSHMSAFILVFSHRYLSVVDDEGRTGSRTCRRAPTPSSPGTSPRRSNRASWWSRKRAATSRSTSRSAADEVVLVAHQSHLLRERAAGRARDRRCRVPRERRRHRAGRKRAAARRRGGRHAAGSVPHDAVRAFHSRGAARRRPVEPEGGVDTKDPRDRSADRGGLSAPHRLRSVRCHGPVGPRPRRSWTAAHAAGRSGGDGTRSGVRRAATKRWRCGGMPLASSRWLRCRASSVRSSSAPSAWASASTKKRPPGSRR